MFQCSPKWRKFSIIEMRSPENRYARGDRSLSYTVQVELRNKIVATRVEDDNDFVGAFWVTIDSLSSDEKSTDDSVERSSDMKMKHERIKHPNGCS